MKQLELFDTYNEDLPPDWSLTSDSEGYNVQNASGETVTYGEYYDEAVMNAWLYSNVEKILAATGWEVSYNEENFQWFVYGDGSEVNRSDCYTSAVLDAWSIKTGRL